MLNSFIAHYLIYFQKHQHGDTTLDFMSDIQQSIIKTT